MFRKLGNLMGRSRDDASAPSVPAGRRVYAIGDIHGRLDLFDALIAKIRADDAARPAADTTIVLLGDLIDRGPDSAGVVERARELSQAGDMRAIIGNHEEMFLRALGDPDALRHFLKVGGKETILSYPVPNEAYRDATLDELCALLAQYVPDEHLAYLRAMETHVVIGDYLFVHAGIKPGVDIAEQSARDLRWIREPFLSHPGPHSHCIVHGHTIREEVEILPSPKRPHRIGIDTGAYSSGRLTAIGLEARERWFIEAALP
ncbi:metallophosphoesterase family protein [Croceicoccus sp. YJ47]|uniref:metallophosphoesterase family protein n=1 Tax=Croceicoccus sp. YJ47 TaxID=2798724 RepID=UPI00192303A3|nr:metallophosphoesterase family protein [Croceicoccus sp. YJ47]QQN74835.1 serine/threonine protein phosphatase [Croceicoccus sp. YJ47]